MLQVEESAAKDGRRGWFACGRAHREHFITASVLWIVNNESRAGCCEDETGQPFTFSLGILGTVTTKASGEGGVGGTVHGCEGRILWPRTHLSWPQ